MAEVVEEAAEVGEADTVPDWLRVRTGRRLLGLCRMVEPRRRQRLSHVRRRRFRHRNDLSSRL